MLRLLLLLRDLHLLDTLLPHEGVQLRPGELLYVEPLHLPARLVVEDRLGRLAGDLGTSPTLFAICLPTIYLCVCCPLIAGLELSHDEALHLRELQQEATPGFSRLHPPCSVFSRRKPL